ncbi:transcription initiation factor tfiid subunit 12 [Anaeramoeba ignava]|uniref:Transcription initiation factor tfiid subunit 12 n=1 Tax=Anaeramoeba ignava TaxID=1746090 RepID=A0A9Q0RJ67_ANAIG|nr:transcription initiation factor tfiid subunit 12 [Anaeramoeba ignava]|eukprot:Anaeramoba_ignava/a658125_26.p1 GENE.a658125_26~~a658125_26.p1  ORF type:complete len:116 (-),score=46.10 a658125_26:14-361(-)
MSDLTRRANISNQPNSQGVSSRKKLKDIISQIDSQLTYDLRVEDFLYEVLDEFVEKITQQACDFALHRNSKDLEDQDIHLSVRQHFSKNLTTEQSTFQQREDGSELKRARTNQKK